MSLPVNSLYSLTWGDYGTSLVSAVQLLRCHGDLVDVTLAAEGRSFEAHKIVLCAASPYLLNLLKVSTTSNHFLHISFRRRRRCCGAERARFPRYLGGQQEAEECWPAFAKLTDRTEGKVFPK